MKNLNCFPVKLCLFVFLSAIAFCEKVKAQTPLIVNKYAKVTDFPSCNPCLNPCNKVIVDDISSFSVGDEVLLIQMKGADMSWANDNTFGDITTYGSAGFHEVLTIASIAGASNLITFSTTIGGNYSVDGKVQLVKKFVAPGNYTVPAAGLGCAPWDGNKGGVLFMEVGGTLNLAGNIDVTGLGFRGAVNPNSNLDITSCGSGGPAGDEFANGVIFLDGSNIQWSGRKGEGIVEFRNPQYELGTGKLSNGGGGGLNHNAGGGGGGNMGAGGKGGDSYIGISNTICGVISNGQGGVSLDRLGGMRLFLGGGGGAGHENNHRGNSGGDGGGIIIIKADKIEGNGNKIISDGFIGFNYDLIQGGKGENDGGGGGGAGGSVKIECDDFGSTALTIQARGGDGGSLNAIDHGPGGGGGGGLVCFSTPSVSNALVKVVSTGGNSGLTGDSTSYGAMNGSPGLTGYSCSTISSKPPKVLLFSAGADQTLCNPGSAVLDTKVEKKGTTFTWYKDGVEITEEKDSAYTANAGGIYVVKVVSANCSSTDTVVIKKTGSEVPVNQYFCDDTGPTTVTLEVGNPSPGANYGWFTEATGGTLLHVGTSYTISGLTKDTMLFVVDTNKVNTVFGPTGTGAAQEYYIADGNNNDITVQEHYREFNVIAPIKLKSVEVRASLNTGGCGYNSTSSRSVIIQLYQNGVATGLSVTGTIQCDVQIKVLLNFDIPPGNNYELRIDALDKGFFKISDEEEVFSIPNVMTILPNVKKSGAFFNWEVEYGAPCGRMPIWAKRSCPLPLMLLSFKGVYSNGEAHLQWTTLLEKNVEGFIIERSVDGFHFEPAGFVEANGSGDYLFSDQGIDNAVYYRLKIIDKDGSSSYSPIIHLKGNDEVFIGLFPNPASEVLYLQFNTGDALEMNLGISDIIGKQITNKELSLAKGFSSIPFDISLLSPGVYLLTMISEEHGVIVRRFEKK